VVHFIGAMKNPLFSRVLWVWLGLAAFSAAALPGTALRFNGVNSYASVLPNGALNAYPLTVSAWFRCTPNNGGVQVIAAKYGDSTFNGWALVVQSGQLHGYFFRSGIAWAIDAYSGTSVVDGVWHHAALVVDTTGGQMFLDGVQVAAPSWTGTQGAMTSSFPLTFGALNTGAYSLNGDVDEVTLWSRALTANEINYLKHRQLRGGEDGLLGDWKFNEGVNITAADATTNHFNATLFNSPAWVPSGAPLDLNMVPTNCLKFAGTSGIITITNAPDLDPYPFTTTAWFRKADTSTGLQIIAAKYAGSSYNGWALISQFGQLGGFYYRRGDVGITTNFVSTFSGTSVTDFGWHHAAWVVDAAGGRLYLDGIQVANSAWSGPAGPMTTTTPITIGAITNTAPNNYPLLGNVDEMTLWSRALSTAEIAAQKNLPLTGSEANLVGYWKLDESIGSTTVSDSAAAHTHPGALSGAAALTGSTAYLGDGSTHLLASLDYANPVRTFAIAGSPAQSAFTENASVTFSRFYDYGSAPASENVSAVLDYFLQTTNATGIPLKQSETILNSSLGAQLASAPRTNNLANGWLSFSNTLALEPNGVQLNSVDTLHQLITTLSHNENGGVLAADVTNTGAATRLLHFDGNLFFGPLLTTFSNLDLAPVVSAVVVGNHLDCSLAVSANAGVIPGTAWRFGDGSVLSVSSALNGDCTLKSGTITPTGPANDTDTIQNISFQRAGLTLNTNGASGVVILNLPAGLGVRLNTAGTRLMTNTLPFFASLDVSLRPQTNVLNQPPVPLTFGSEILPCWITTSQFSWRVYDGQLVIPANNIQFVRQFEDDVLTANQFSLTDTNAAKRISNDAYFRNAQIYAPSNGFIITADTNGFAQVNGNITLAPPELRPHFPYTDTQPGSQLPTANGLFSLQNSLVASNSFLGLSAAVPILYSRDCTDTNCSGATAGLATVNLAPPANQLSFTPDGGLLGYGPVSTPLTPGGVALTWGFNSAGIYAQQTSPVGNGVFEMAGNFLRGDQTATTNSQRAAVLLFSGWGDAANPNYLERFGTSSYADGFANYAGLNLRAPATASSTIANVPTGAYPLTARAKYYVRNGGVSGIHEAASFPPNFSWGCPR
jgi:hypothetical protein